MGEILKYLEIVYDEREQGKVLHKLKDIIVIVLFAKLANADQWQEIHQFAVVHESLLKGYISLDNGIPSMDTIRRNFGIISSKVLERIQTMFNEMLSTNEGEKLQKILAIDGKTQRGNGNCKQAANHIVSAVSEDRVCFGEKLVDKKSNEITAIPQLLKELNVQGQIVTIDAMGAQREIVAQIRKQRADYVISLKGNQGTLHEEVAQYFEDEELIKKCTYTYQVEKAHGGIEKREYWLLSDISWLAQGEKWTGLKSVGMTRNTITKNGETITETRFFISSLGNDVELFARAVRGHWVVESFHWLLDVVFREDANRTLDKRAAFNLNIINKIALSVLRICTLGMKPMSLKHKRYTISLDPARFLKMILAA